MALVTSGTEEWNTVVASEVSIAMHAKGRGTIVSSLIVRQGGIIRLDEVNNPKVMIDSSLTVYVSVLYQSLLK